MDMDVRSRIFTNLTGHHLEVTTDLPLPLMSTPVLSRDDRSLAKTQDGTHVAIASISGDIDVQLLVFVIIYGKTVSTED